MTLDPGRRAAEQAMIMQKLKRAARSTATPGGPYPPEVVYPSEVVYTSAVSVLTRLAAIGRDEQPVSAFLTDADNTGQALDAALAVFGNYDRTRGVREALTADAIEQARRGAAKVVDAVNAELARLWLVAMQTTCTGVQARLGEALAGIQAAEKWSQQAKTVTGRPITPLAALPVAEVEALLHATAGLLEVLQKPALG